MINKFRGVKTTEQYCKVGNVTRIEVETEKYENDESYQKPIKWN